MPELPLPANGTIVATDVRGYRAAVVTGAWPCGNDLCRHVGHITVGLILPDGSSATEKLEALDVPRPGLAVAMSDRTAAYEFVKWVAVGFPAEMLSPGLLAATVKDFGVLAPEWMILNALASHRARREERNADLIKLHDYYTDVWPWTAPLEPAQAEPLTGGEPQPADSVVFLTEAAAVLTRAGDQLSGLRAALGGWIGDLDSQPYALMNAYIRTATLEAAVNELAYLYRADAADQDRRMAAERLFTNVKDMVRRFDQQVTMGPSPVDTAIGAALNMLADAAGTGKEGDDTE